MDLQICKIQMAKQKYTEESTEPYAFLDDIYGNGGMIAKLIDPISVIQ